MSDKYDNDDSNYEDNTPLSALAESRVMTIVTEALNNEVEELIKDIHNSERELMTNK